MSTIYEDTRQHRDKHKVKHEWFADHGVTLERKYLKTGDYMREGSNVTVDTKASVDEIAANISSQHKRFKNECERAQADGLRLVVLVENMQGFTEIRDLYRWTNTHCATCHVRRSASCNPRGPDKCPRHKKHKPMQGDRLAAAMLTMERKYGVRFEFCKPKDSAKRICELLGVGYEQDATSGEGPSRAGVSHAAD